MTPTQISAAVAEGKKLAVAWKGEPAIFSQKVKATTFLMRRENALGERIGTVSAVYSGGNGTYTARVLEGEEKTYFELIEAVTAVDGELEAAGFRLIGRVIWR